MKNEPITLEVNAVNGLDSLPETIETNILIVAERVKAECAAARSLVIDPHSISDIEFAEKRAAALRRDSKGLMAFRTALSKRWNAPLADFETACKSLESELRDAANDIYGKANDGRKIAKDEKRQMLMHEWSHLMEAHGFCADEGKYPGYLDTFFARRCDESEKGCWLNRSAKPKDITKEMETELVKMNDAIKQYSEISGTVDVMAGAAGFNKLYATCDLAAAVLEMNNYQAEQKRLAETAKAVAIAGGAETARVNADASAEVETESIDRSVEIVQNEANAVIGSPDEKIETYRLAVSGTRTALTQMRKWGEAHGIKFALIKSI